MSACLALLQTQVLIAAGLVLTDKMVCPAGFGLAHAGQ
jgi:hypothetical protein